MRTSIFCALLLVLPCLSGAAQQAGSPAEIRITADNTYWLWLNPGTLTGDGTSDPGFLGSSPSDDWMTPEYYRVTLKEGANVILVKAENIGESQAGNPAGLIAEVRVGTRPQA